MGRKGRVKRRAEGLSRGLLLVRGIPVEVVGHEENVGSRRDEGMARFHNLKAQETECTHQFSCENQEETTRVTMHNGLAQKVK